MSKNWLVVVGLIVAVGLISAVITYIRAPYLSSPGEVGERSLASLRKGHLAFYGAMLPLVVGAISFFVYRAMLTRWPETAQTTFLWLAVGLAVVMTIGVVIVFKWKGVVEMTALHALYVAGFGWAMPMLLKFA